MLRVLAKVLFSFAFIMGGANHFIDPVIYTKMMPDYLPMHLELVYISGVVEILLGVLLMIPKTQKLAAWGIIFLLIAIFPANLHMYNNPELFPEIPPLVLAIRLPIQLIIIYWAYRYTKGKAPNELRA
jgi:uncharacterized membrane protein